CKHYGGSVVDVGFMLFYGVQRSAYCDTTDTYLFQHRREKIIVQLAGMVGSLVELWILIQLCHFLSPNLLVYRVRLLVFGWRGFSLFENLVPFVKLDGYYALAEYLDLPNLRERSFEYVARRLKKVVLGIAADESPEPNEREKTIYIIFGVTAGVYSI